MYHEAYTHSSGTLLTEIFALLQFFIQFTFCCIFQYQIHSGLQSQKSKGKFGSTSYIFYSFQWTLKHSIDFFFPKKKGKEKKRKCLNLIIEVAIKAQYVPMPQMTLYLNFSAKLMLYLRLFQLAFEQDLECHNMTTLLRKISEIIHL